MNNMDEFIWAYNIGTYPMHFPYYLVRENDDSPDVYVRSCLDKEFSVLIQDCDFLEILKLENDGL